MHKGPRGTEAVESGHVVAIQDVRGLDKKQNGKGWSDEGVSYTVDTHATQGVAMCEIDTVGTLRAHHPGTAGVQSDTDHLVAFTARDYGADATEDLAPTMRSLSKGADGHQAGSHGLAVAFQPTADCLTAAYGTKWNGNASATNGSLFAQQQSTVRRLTPVECERLQGFPDNFTAIPWRKKGAEDCPDGPRYKALGNSMAVPVMRWIGERINAVDDLISLL
jgi:DNA (cytosine-5)-methyltransferase 1